MTNQQPRRLHVLRENARELLGHRERTARMPIDWLVLIVWLGIGAVCLSIMILTGVSLGALIHVVWERFR